VIGWTPLHVRKDDEAVGVADVKPVADKGHAERLVQALHKNFLGLGDAITIGVAQESDAIRTHPHGRGPFHRADHGVVENASRGSFGEAGFGD